MAITLFGSASNPADNGSNSTSPVVITPPGSMQAGDLVFVTVEQSSTSGTISVSQAGGQTWTSLTQRNQTRNRTRSFWCRFNGTWSANPSWTTASANSTARMLVFRGDYGVDSNWQVDVAESSNTYAAPSSPYTVTITGVTTTQSALVIAGWTSADDNTWGSLTSGWTAVSPAQVRNTYGTYQQSVTHAWRIVNGSSGNVAQNQATLGGDAGTYIIMAFRERRFVTATAGGKNEQSASSAGSVIQLPPATAVDLYFDWRSGADGDALTDARALGGVWPSSPPQTPVVYPSSPASILKIETDAACPYDALVRVGGENKNLSDVTQGMIHDHATTASEEIRCTVPSSKAVVSIGFFFKTTIDSSLYTNWGHCGIQGISDAEWSILSTWIDGSGIAHACIEHNGGTYPSDGMGPTLARDTWYWITIQYNKTSGMLYLAVYLASTMVQVGSTISGATVASPPDVWCIDIGLTASEGNSESGAASYYGAAIVDWTDGTFPLLPTVEEAGEDVFAAAGSFNAVIAAALAKRTVKLKGGATNPQIAAGYPKRTVKLKGAAANVQIGAAFLKRTEKGKGAGSNSQIAGGWKRLTTKIVSASANGAIAGGKASKPAYLKAGAANPTIAGGRQKLTVKKQAGSASGAFADGFLKTTFRRQAGGSNAAIGGGQSNKPAYMKAGASIGQIAAGGAPKRDRFADVSGSNSQLAGGRQKMTRAAKAASSQAAIGGGRAKATKMAVASAANVVFGWARYRTVQTAYLMASAANVVFGAGRSKTTAKIKAASAAGQSAAGRAGRITTAKASGANRGFAGALGGTARIVLAKAGAWIAGIAAGRSKSTDRAFVSGANSAAAGGRAKATEKAIASAANAAIAGGREKATLRAKAFSANEAASSARGGMGRVVYIFAASFQRIAAIARGFITRYIPAAIDREVEPRAREALVDYSGIEAIVEPRDRDKTIEIK